MVQFLRISVGPGRPILVSDENVNPTPTLYLAEVIE
jgi:hypothetical protein